MKAVHPKALIQLLSREICTCSVLTVTLLLLYRKVIPLRFLPCCDNLITLGSRRILVFLCFSKVKSRRVIRAFRVPSRQPLDQIGWNPESMLSKRSPTKPCLRILIIFLIKKLCLFFAGSSFFSLFKIDPLVKKITNACATNLRHGFWGQCVKKRMPC